MTLTKARTFFKQDNTTLSWLLLVVLSLIWGSSFILIKRGLLVYSPLQVATLRIFSAGVFCLFFSVFQYRNIPFHRWKYALIGGLLGNFFPSILFALAGSKLQSSVSGILNAFTPLATLLIGLIFYNRPVAKFKILGIIIGFLGCVWLVFESSKGKIQFNSYALLPLLAALSYGINLNFYKRYLSDVPPAPLAMLALAMVAIPAGMFLFSTDVVDKTITNPNAWFSMTCVIILGLFGSAIATILSNKLNQIATPLLASSVTYMIPVIAVLWGVWDGEDFGWSHLLGMATIVAGIYLVNSKKEPASVNLESKKNSYPE
ncbi:MAG: DMT family transporter [Verrucomicrobia bacterium]|nr:DMT family transporter [Cytophagales bacterium]